MSVSIISLPLWNLGQTSGAHRPSTDLAVGLDGPSEVLSCVEPAGVALQQGGHVEHAAPETGRGDTTEPATHHALDVCG